jgi:hypothetical protein
VTFLPVISSPKQTIFAVFLSSLISKPQKHFHRDSNLGQIIVVVASVPIIYSPKQITFVLAPFFYRAYFPSYRKHLHRDSNPGQFFGVVTSVPIIYSPKQITFVLVTFFCRAYFPSYRKHLHRDSNPGQFYGVLPLVSVSVSSLRLTTLFLKMAVFWVVAPFARTSDTLVNFGLGAVLLSCLVSKLQESPSQGLELRTLFRSFDLYIFSSWSQGMST